MHPNAEISGATHLNQHLMFYSLTDSALKGMQNV